MHPLNFIRYLLAMVCGRWYGPCRHAQPTADRRGRGQVVVPRDYRAVKETAWDPDRPGCVPERRLTGGAREPAQPRTKPGKTMILLDAAAAGMADSSEGDGKTRTANVRTQTVNSNKKLIFMSCEPKDSCFPFETILIFKIY